ncbi:hypothetical protein [Aequorivita viscosa]|uniref:Uncharacterized protein n=1 Tax=Aequorivita viscosa TaxID=797419 RepID=A0A1M5ZZ63_9FLAO|nr:hypothetical protein [Aequorivita viscosa]SDW08251.1 hypothetical protein SAMN05216556_1024 [Aequorivita viscosa]SHI29478.1 hypothetical protein SAMN04487908_1014 [Aequorivita viscosa]
MASKNNFPPIIEKYNVINYYIQDGKLRQRRAVSGFTFGSIKNNPNMTGICKVSKSTRFTVSSKRILKRHYFHFLVS